MTHTDAAHGDNGEGSQDSCSTNNPVETQKENHTQDVLHAGQVNSNESSHLGDLWVGEHTHTHATGENQQGRQASRMKKREVSNETQNVNVV